MEERICISRELYVSLTIDRAARKPVFLVSEMGGVEIEDLARRYPGKIKRIYIDPEVGYTSYMARIALTALNLPWSLIGYLDSLLKSMYRIKIEYDAELVEFNPLVLTCDGRLVAVDAKIIVDDNSLQRHPELQSQHKRQACSIHEAGNHYINHRACCDGGWSIQPLYNSVDARFHRDCSSTFMHDRPP